MTELTSLAGPLAFSLHVLDVADLAWRRQPDHDGCRAVADDHAWRGNRPILSENLSAQTTRTGRCTSREQAGGPGQVVLEAATGGDDVARGVRW